MSTAWPWYDRVTGASLDQGDIFDRCPVLRSITGPDAQLVAQFDEITAIVLTQTCDLEQAKVGSVVVCAVFSVAEVVLQVPESRRSWRGRSGRVDVATTWPYGERYG